MIPSPSSPFDVAATTRRALSVPLALAGVALMTGLASAQVTADDFDIDRAFLGDGTMFVPFVVTETRLLADALEDGTLSDGTALLVFDHEMGKLAFVTQQLAYHHVAQGEMAGEPWMVSF